MQSLMFSLEALNNDSFFSCRCGSLLDIISHCYLKDGRLTQLEVCQHHAHFSLASTTVSGWIKRENQDKLILLTVFNHSSICHIELIGSMIALVLMGMVYEGIKVGREMLKRKAARPVIQRETYNLNGDGCKKDAPPTMIVSPPRLEQIVI